MNSKKLSNSFSTGSGGAHFEAHVQASFVVLMLTGGYAPCLPCKPIVEIKLQGKIDGCNMDDLIVFVGAADSNERCKLLAQVKHSITITQRDPIFSEVIKAAWDDYKNPERFKKGKDVLALITGPLSKTDSDSVRWLLSKARTTKNTDEFYTYVEQAYFSSQENKKKLEAFEKQIELANDNVKVSKEEVHSFLKHFYLLGYDLGEEEGVVLSLLHSHMSQFRLQYPSWAWGRIVDFVQTYNQHAGTITLEKIPDDIKKAFRQPDDTEEAFRQSDVAHIPKELLNTKTETDNLDWNQHSYATNIALLNLVGTWNEKNQEDINILNNVTQEAYSTLVQKIREILQLSDSPFSLRNGIWKIIERTSFWEILGSRVFDKNLEVFKEAAVSVLTERDPSFVLPKEERYMAGIHGKVLTYSQELREGLAEGLALVGSRPAALVNCSYGKAENTAVLAIREIFAEADWVRWGSLNNLLPILAEVAPDEFLNAVENALNLEPCPFDELFAQEGVGFTGCNYLSGLLWALEGLAWDEMYLVRVCVILGEIASHDPGGNWANRPANSLLTILLPWLPQTFASIEKRKVAVQTICKEQPDIAWKLIISLLPNQRQGSMGSYKPKWRIAVPEDFGKDINAAEYREQVLFYAALSVSMANHDIAKLCELIDHFDNLPKPSFDQLLEVLSSDDILELPEDVRLPLWDSLRKFTSRHRCFSDSDWALNNDLLTSIEVVADKLAPLDYKNLYQPLFSDLDGYLYDANDNFEEQQKKLDESRQKAVAEILKLGGLEAVIKFTDSVEFPDKVGLALGYIAEKDIDMSLFPEYLSIKDIKHLNFINGYIWGRHWTKGWSWAVEIDKENWSVEQMGQFLSSLPFTKEAWDLAAEWLDDSQGSYWLKTNANPYKSESSLGIAIDKLIEYGRPRVAIDCLSRMLYKKQPISTEQCIRALLSAVSSSEPHYSMDGYHIVKLIKWLQKTPDVSPDDLFHIEWAYLPLLDGHNGAVPKLLENHLATAPEFFCEVIRLIYRSKKDAAATHDLSEEKKVIANNAWDLLNNWNIPPGTQEDGSFNEAHFFAWLNRVKEICAESGHLEVALINVGHVLIHCPADKSGLWINKAVAEALNEKDSEPIRSGFCTGTYNSRGAHWIDPTGKPERELAELYKKKAEDIENAGYQRFAVTLRNLSKSYEREAERIISEHTYV